MSNVAVILIVDDYRDGAEALRRILGSKGYPCQWVGSGSEALAMIRAHPPELPLLVVLDDMMPEMTGIEVLEAIRMDPKISSTTVIIFSAGFDVSHRAEALMLGAAAWLLKGGATGATIDVVVNTIIKWYTTVGGVSVIANADDDSDE